MAFKASVSFYRLEMISRPLPRARDNGRMWRRCWGALGLSTATVTESHKNVMSQLTRASLTPTPYEPTPHKFVDYRAFH